MIEEPFLKGQLSVNTDLNVAELWHACYREKWKILFLTVSVVMIATLLVFSITPIYRATATLLVEKQAAKAVSIEQVYGLDGRGSEYLFTQFELLKSRSLLETVVQELNLAEHPDFNPENRGKMLAEWRKNFFEFADRYKLPLISPAEIDGEEKMPLEKKMALVVKAFSSSVTIEPVRGTQLVRVHVDMSDPRLAARAADALANAYIESQLDAKLDMTQTATTWLNDRMGNLKQNLQESERRLQDYLQQENLVDVKGVTTVTADELSQTGRRLSDARKDREIADSQYRQVQALQGSHWERIATLPFVGNDAQVQQFNSLYAQSRSKVEELSLRYGPKHPKMKSARSELETARENLRHQVERVVAGIEKNYQGAAAKERALQYSYDRNREAIQEIGKKEFRLRELQLEVESNRSLYDTFMTRFKETTATSDFEATNARIVDSAALPLSPVKPKKKLLILLAGMSAFTLSIFLVILSELLTSKFRTPEELESFVNIPVVGSLPDAGRSRVRSIANLYSRGKNQLFSESIRSIRTGMLLSKKPEGGNVFMLTSSVPSEGKTTVACNLAQALSEMGSVILVDADLRRPGISKGFDLSRDAKGLSNILNGEVNLADCIRKEQEIDLLPAGKVLQNPVVLFASQDFAKLIKVLEHKYDYVVIDSPPVLAVSEPLIIATLASEILYVVKAEQTSSNMIKAGLQKVQSTGARISGIIFNRMDMSNSSHYQKYYS